MSSEVIKIFNYACSDCEYKTDWYNSLRRHQDTEHDNEGVVFRCHLCESILKNSDQLSRHIKTVHTQEVFKCKICGFLTNTLFNLKRHTNNVHNAERELKDCPICGKKAKDLTKHRYNVHKKNIQNHNEKMMNCPSLSCDFVTHTKKSLGNHRWKVHKKILCKYCDFSTTIRKQMTAHTNAIHISMPVKRFRKRK